MKREILDGKKFGEWTVIEYAGDKKQLCQCSCGEVREVATYSLTSGKSKNCGNKSKHLIEGQKRFKDLTGKVFGELTAMTYLGDTYWECVCKHGHHSKHSWKHLSLSSTCPVCRTAAQKALTQSRRESLLQAKTQGNIQSQSSIAAVNKDNPTAKKDMTNFKINDITVIKQVSADRYLCKCKCGVTREIRGYNLRHPPSPSSYKCKHKVNLNDTFGKLTIIDRLPNGMCKCKCECGNEKLVFIGNLLNGSTTSCGCNKAPKYSKEEVLEKIQKFIQETGDKPFSKELATLLDLGMTAVYEYIENYDLKQYINQKFGSLAEKDIYNMLKSKYTVILHDRKILNGLELDIYIPEIKTAIEFNGVYWHKYPLKDKDYHQKKTLECAKHGIRLIHIFEYEWENETYKPKILAMLNGLMEKNKILYARNLQIKEISSSEAYDFENDNHIQGKVTSQINIALYDNTGSMFGLMTFGKPRFDSNYQYELTRLCFKNGYSVVGGSEKLFEYFINKYNPSSILTYNNLSKFTGEVYRRLGFKIVPNNPITQPNYVWVDNHYKKILTRYATMKKDLVAKGLGTEDMSEDEIMMGLGYNKMYDSGSLKYEYIRG